MYRWLTALFAITTLVLAWALWPHLRSGTGSTQEPPDEDIVFPRKTFVSLKPFVAVKGTLVGDWVAYKNNTFSILCDPGECMVVSISQIGPNQVGSINGPIAYPVKRWTNDEVVAQDDALCARITLTFDRKSETVLWVETPINQTEIACKDADNRVRKATIEHSLFWRRSISKR